MSKLGTALVAAGFFTTGIVVGNVVWEGGDSVDNIEGNVTQMEQDISEALADNEYLTEQFNALMTKHNESIDEANAEIQRIDSERNKLTAQIEELQQVAEGDYSEDEAEIQAEITRLESELEKANAEVAELETFVQEAADRSSYEGIDRSQFDADAAGGNLQSGAAVTYTDGLVELVGQAEASRLAGSSVITQLEAGFTRWAKESNGQHDGITSVGTYEGYPAFYITYSGSYSKYYSNSVGDVLEQPFYTVDSEGVAKFFE
ncbi:hypothetical protein [Jeotgalicoccus halotolerans]|uniref:Uncharacterized protein n=1 Tax=Jeotgalicoccus halotolerans TaxID=157227 RepID=A0A3E0AYP5_9STAP|nr:hypothetical protein [Jeotgalicoccus halotolerans]REG23802.1 hypothetical protein DFR63_1549 [Jeotgalicoccus halotolerans]